MSIEDGGNSPEGARESELKFIRLQFVEGNLDHDVYNQWASEGVIFSATNEEQPRHLRPTLSDEDWNRLKPKQRYAERMQRGRLPGEIKLIMELSDPGAVAAYDKLVDEFNADLERIKREKDVVAVRKFYHLAADLIYSKK